jgi:hypothetical protein
MKRAWLSLLILLECLAAGTVHAACTSPAGNEADQFYNKDFHTYQYCNGTSWVAFGGGFGSGAYSFISTQTASASASLQFTNLPTSYNTLFLNCTGLLTSVSTSSSPYFRVGEGTGGSFAWESAAHYTVSSFYSGSGGDNGGGGLTNATDLTSDAGSGNYSTSPLSMKAYIDNVGSSTLYKNVVWQKTFGDSGNEYYYNPGAGYWNNDTNPITGLEVAAQSGNLTSGTCSLYGMNCNLDMVSPPPRQASVKVL